MADNSNNSNDKRSRLHIKKDIPELGMQINAFGDIPSEVVSLITVTSTFLFHPEQLNDAQRQMHAAQVRTEAASSQKAAAPRTRTAPASQNGGKPVCQDCGTDEAVELINFTDRDTGEAKARFKCGDCNKWLGKAFAAQR